MVGWVFDVELGVRRVADTPSASNRGEPVFFRGVDCSLLAERYAAYRREKGLDTVPPAAPAMEASAIDRSELPAAPADGALSL